MESIALSLIVTAQNPSQSEPTSYGNSHLNKTASPYGLPVAVIFGEIVPYGFSVHFPFRKDHGITEREKWLGMVGTLPSPDRNEHNPHRLRGDLAVEPTASCFGYKAIEHETQGYRRSSSATLQ